MYPIAIFAPLLGALIAGSFGRIIGDRSSQIVTILCMVIAASCGLISLFDLISHPSSAGSIALGTWIDAGSFHVSWTLRYDMLSAVMVAMVTFVATLIHIYSVGYMGHETQPVARFFSYLSLFSFAMLMLVTANNLLQLFFGWEGVGLASYLLIGYWYQKPSACAAAIKAFVVNRVGDLFFAVGIALIFYIFKTISFSAIFQAIPEHLTESFHLLSRDFNAYEVIGVLLFIGAMGKSAQIGLHVWLPDAMEGPTPVSALIHAATMVTAGVFLMARMSPLLEYAPDAKNFIVFIGGSTALFAATIGCTQTDIKRVIAYSTCSQLGYMFIAAGVGAYQVSIFHLITHAFFKALLFLSSGSVIHAMSDEQDMRKMGGLWKKIPVTYAMMWIGSLALAGVPFFAGYYSKDAILDASFAAHSPIAIYGFLCGVLAALLTAFYSWRLIIMTFHGEFRSDAHKWAHVHESPWVMLIPLLLLSLGAIFGGIALDRLFIGPDWQTFWHGAIYNRPSNHVLEAMEHISFLASHITLLMAILGIAMAYLSYMVFPTIPARASHQFPRIYRFLLNKWFFDEFYDRVLVRPLMRLAGALWVIGDQTIIDGVPNGLAALAKDSSNQVVKLQTGSIAVYAFSMFIGLVSLITVYLVFG